MMNRVECVMGHLGWLGRPWGRRGGEERGRKAEAEEGGEGGGVEEGGKAMAAQRVRGVARTGRARLAFADDRGRTDLPSDVSGVGTPTMSHRVGKMSTS